MERRRSDLDANRAIEFWGVNGSVFRNRGGRRNGARSPLQCRQEDLALGIGFYLADSEEAAIACVRNYHDERYKWFAPFGFVRYADEQGRPWGTPGAPARTPRIEDGVAQKAWMCGPPDRLIEFLKQTEEKYPGLEHVVLHWAEGMPRNEALEQIQRFAEEVMPAFQRDEVAGHTGV